MQTVGNGHLFLFFFFLILYIIVVLCCNLAPHSVFAMFPPPFRNVIQNRRDNGHCDLFFFFFTRERTFGHVGTKQTYFERFKVFFFVFLPVIVRNKY